MLKDSYKKHVYDVDIMAIYDSIDSQFNKHPEFLEQKEDFKESLTHSFKEYCKTKEIDFDFHFANRIMIVIPSQEPFYEYALSIMLLYYEIPKINLFLNYQKANYKGEGDFIGLIEFIVYDIISKEKLFNNQSRLERIIQWVENNRTKKAKSKLVPGVPGSENKVESLVWDATKLEDLQTLSAKLKLHGYIGGKTDFAKVFTHKQPISWLKQAEFLAHLLYSLYESQLFKTSKGKGYFSIAEHYFSCYSENSDKKFSLKDRSSRVNKGAIKYSKIRKEVKETIENSIKII